MGEVEGDSPLLAGLDRLLARCGLGAPEGAERLTGGAMMESWRVRTAAGIFVLRRAPSADFMAERPYGHESEAALVAAAHAAGVTAPEVVAVLRDDDGIGSGYLMRALPGTAEPRAIQAMGDTAQILAEAGRDLARIHAIPAAAIPADIPTLEPAAGVAELRRQFEEETGGDRPVIALGLRWLLDHLPAPIAPVLNHGDFRLGNLLAAESHLTGVLDWEIAHLGDPHEDIAFGCLPVWRFGRPDLPALGLGRLEDYLAAYQAAGGIRVDPARLRFWTVYRMVWWALGCLRQARVWREGQDRMLERVVISRRTSEQELDLLLLLEEDATASVRAAPLPTRPRFPADIGEATAGEIAAAVAEWLGTFKHRMEGHDRFQLAVARNALGIVARDWDSGVTVTSAEMARDILSGALDPLKDGETLAVLRHLAIEKLATDSPKYPSLAVARRKWTGED